MFWKNKEVWVTKWQPATWDGKAGYAKNSDGKGRQDWDFYAKLPPDVDPKYTKLGHTDGAFTVSYRVADTLAWRLVELLEYTRHNHLINFGAYMNLEDLKKAVGLENIKQSPSPLLEL